MYDLEFNDDDTVYTTTTMTWIMLTFCIQQKSSKTTYDLGYTWVNDFGPHTDSNFRGQLYIE